MITEELIKGLLEGKTLTAKEIVELGSLNITPRKLANQLSYYRCVNVRVECKPHKYELKMPITFTGNVQKDKNILKLELDNGSFIQYDFNKKTFISDIIPHNCAEGIGDNIVLQIFCNNYYRDLREIEWIYSYMDLLDTNLYNLRDLNEYKNCPSGYINWIKSNNLKINDDTIKLFIATKEYPNIPFPLLEQLVGHYNYRGRSRLLKVANLLFSSYNLDRIIRNSVKKYNWNIFEDYYTFVDVVGQCLNNEIDLSELIDSNRTLKENTSNLKSILDQQQNELLGKNLKKLNFINNLEVEDYIVVVPQSVEDLINEGKQQNNCVGHFYNNSIAKGENLIYFLRDKNDINQSIITCRYNLNKNATIEHRVKNNRLTNYHQDLLIEQIDKIIRENLLTF